MSLSPRNHLGANYDADRNITDDAKLVRRDIAAAVKMGLIADAKYSVRIDRFSMGQAINVTVTGADLVEVVDHPDGYGKTRQRTTLGAETVAFVEQILSSYNHDRSDTQTDYFDVKFYTTVALRDPAGF